jgi:putative ATPase
VSEDLFTPPPDASSVLLKENMPLAERMRPRNLEEMIGQEHLLAPGKLVDRTIKADRLMSCILYGPPGTGKTTLARLIAKRTSARFIAINAVASNVAEIRKIITDAYKYAGQSRTVLFIDEIHRFNKAQQDILMPEVERGIISLLGATTQNPFFSVNNALLSRSLLLELKAHTTESLVGVMQAALADEERGFGKEKIKIEEGALEHLARSSQGDARRSLNSLEIGILSSKRNAADEIEFTLEDAQESVQKKMILHDRDGDEHYDTLSALIKSIRGSDPDAALYWTAKLLCAGEEPRAIMRRLVISASEDIGNADSKALILAQSAAQAIEFVGMPEAEIIIGQLVTYLASTQKSNASYLAMKKAMEAVTTQPQQKVPQHLKDSHYAGAQKLGHGKDYKYPHDYPHHYVKQNYLTKPLKFYEPSQEGEEKRLSDLIEFRKKL